tara:strand:- start:7777 stop:8754 length:978 start_codon:yes stop_codon:yes gene_type:complete
MPIKNKKLKKTHSDKRVTIDAIHSKIINNFSNIEEEDEYYLENGELLNNYYESKNNITDNTDDNSILNFFDNKKKDDRSTKNDTDIVSEYISNINDEFIFDKFNSEESLMFKCKYCNVDMNFKLIESELFCNKCGYTVDILVNSDKISYKDVPRELSYFAYKRINHFNEWLAQFQGKETTIVPIKVFEDVKNELKKNINLKPENIKYSLIRDILKSTNNNKYYENIPLIINIVTGKNAPVLSPGLEEKLRNMFKEIQIPFMKHCPENRKNFLSYSYVLHKFCELLELDDLLEFFPLLKSREKLKQQDKIWVNICKELQWQYIPSI